jgi:RanGTP-binding protein
MIIEDLDDDRVHTFDEGSPQPSRYDDVELAGVREVFPIHQISKIFYADTGKVLNIGTEGELNNPFLLLKRDLNAIPPRMKISSDEIVQDDEEPVLSSESTSVDEAQTDEQQKPTDPWHLPPNLDPEWIALEVFTEPDDSEDEGSEIDTSVSPSPQGTQAQPVVSQLTAMMPDLRINADPASATTSPGSNKQPLAQSTSHLATKAPPPWVNSIRTSLSLLEMLLRLTSLQQFQQQSHLSITDELLNFFLEESAATGAGGDETHRQRLRSDARRRVGWDPYDESPVKRRGENYQYQNGYFDENGSWTPSGMQTRPITGMSDAKSPSPSPSTKGRKEWLKKSEDRKGSPLRPSTGRSDEGIGTSPASAPEMGRGAYGSVTLRE